MRPAGGWNHLWGIRRASAERISAVRICAEHRSVPVPSDIDAPLENVAAVGVAHVLLELKHVSVRTEDRSVRRIESLEQSVPKRQRNIRMVTRRKHWRAAHIIEQRR